MHMIFLCSSKANTNIRYGMKYCESIFSLCLVRTNHDIMECEGDWNEIQWDAME